MSYSREDLGRRLDAGYRWQWFVAYHLGRAGFDVRVSKHRLRDEGEDPEPFRHEVDVYVSLDGARWEPIEVKSKNEDFTGPWSWPFDDVFCYGARKLQRGIPVLFVSIPTKIIVGICTDGSDWRTGEAYDRERDLSYPVFRAPRRELRSFEDWCGEMKGRLTSPSS